MSNHGNDGILISSRGYCRPSIPLQRWKITTSNLLVIGCPLLLPLSAQHRNKQQIYSLITYTFIYFMASWFENITVNIVTEVHSRKEQGVIEQKGYRLEGQSLAALDGITGVINPHLDLPPPSRWSDGSVLGLI